MFFFFSERKDIKVLLFLIYLIVSVIQSHAQVKSAKDLKEPNNMAEYVSNQIYTDTVKDAKKGNLVPFPVPITDENLGYGGVLGIAYMKINQKSSREHTPRTITGIAGGGTSTGTWLATVFHSQTFRNDRIRYDGVIGYADVYLDFYLLEKFEFLKFPINTNISFWGTQHQVLFRFGNSKFFLGPQYRYMNINSEIKLELNHPNYDDLVFYKNIKERVSALALLGNYDNRDQKLSPVTGYYTGFVYRMNADWLGATRNYFSGDLFAYAYYKVGSRLYSIFNFDYQFIQDTAPFYSKPYIGLRGIPAMRYQANQVATMQMQWRVDVIKNFSLVAFTGIGKAYNSFEDFNSSDWVYNYGTGVRYTLKNVDNLRVGVDFGWGKDNFGWVISFGTGL